MNLASLIPPVFGLALAPLFLGMVNRAKAVIAGRHGQPLLQGYFDLWKLLHKGAVYSSTATWVFRAGPIVSLAAALAGLCLVPFGGIAAPLSFTGDVIVLAGLLGLVRFFTVAAALDTGSSFEGMGASREVLFAAVAEPALFLALAALAQQTGALSLSAIYGGLSYMHWATSGHVLALAGATLFVVFLAENARIPVDDPTTHLELTMIHEVMVLDHSGPDFAFISYGAALKHWILGTLVVGVAMPLNSAWSLLNLLAALLGMFALAVALGAVESSMARLRLVRVPQLLVGAGALSALALIFGMMR